MTSSASILDLRDSDISLPIASAWLDAHPPALPMVVEDLKRLAVFVFIDRDVNMSAAGLHEPGAAAVFIEGLFLGITLPASAFGSAWVFSSVFPVLSTCSSREPSRINGNSLAAGLVCEPEYIFHIPSRCLVGKVDGLGHSVVRKFLERRLHLYMIHRSNVMRPSQRYCVSPPGIR